MYLGSKLIHFINETCITYFISLTTQLPFNLWVSGASNVNVVDFIARTRSKCYQLWLFTFCFQMTRVHQPHLWRHRWATWATTANPAPAATARSLVTARETLEDRRWLRSAGDLHFTKGYTEFNSEKSTTTYRCTTLEIYSGDPSTSPVQHSNVPK